MIEKANFESTELFEARVKIREILGRLTEDDQKILMKENALSFIAKFHREKANRYDAFSYEEWF